MQHLDVFYGVIGFSFLLLAIVLFILWALGQIQRRKRDALEQARLYAEVMAQEKDKARITYQLHEDFAQVIAAVRLFMGRFTLTDEEEIDLRKDACNYLDESITKIRGIALEYLPPSIRKNDLEATLYDYTNYINKEHNTLITLAIPEPLGPISSDKIIALYRIVQEIIDNTIAHARATELVITVEKQEGQLMLKAKDNGRGFDYEGELRREKGKGLNNIITRVKLLKGTMKVKSVKPGGTMYIIEVPL